MKKHFSLPLLFLCFSATMLAQEKTTPPLHSNHHLFSMNVGYGYRFDQDHDIVFAHAMDKEYYQKISHGTAVAFEYNYALPYFAFGFQTKALTSFHSDSLRKDDTYTFYLAPTLTLMSGDLFPSTILWFKLSCGYLYYRHAATTTITTVSGKKTLPLTLRGGGIGYGIETGADYYFNDIFGVSVSLAYLGGSIQTLYNHKDESVSLSPKESSNRIECLAGVKIRL